MILRSLLIVAIPYLSLYHFWYFFLARVKSQMRFQSVLQCIAMRCSVLQCVVVSCSVLHCRLKYRVCIPSVLMAASPILRQCLHQYLCVIVCCSVLQCVAMLQCVAVCFPLSFHVTSVYLCHTASVCTSICVLVYLFLSAILARFFSFSCFMSRWIPLSLVSRLSHLVRSLPFSF